MRYGMIYLVVKDFQRSLDFYKKVLDMQVSETNGERFAVFNNDGLNIEKKGESFPIYDDTVSIVDSENSRKAFINIVVSDLQKEYDRIISLGIAEKITPIRYLNVFAPYWYFTFADPDGNPIEITGEYQEIK